MAPVNRGFQPPASVGEPFRADPADPAPFLTDNDRVPVVPVEPAPYVEPAGFDAAAPPAGHPPSRSPEYGGPQPHAPSGDRPTFQQPGSVPRQLPPATPAERFARTAFWVGVASVFVFNVVIGPIAVLMGAIAIRRGEKRLGTLAIVFGGIGTAIGILLLVLVATGVLPSVDQMLRDIRNGR